MLNHKVLEEILKKYRENKLAHAYLIETNNINKAESDLKELIKAINCPEDFNNNCTNCNLCNLINKGNLPSLITVEPDGASIKKGQIEELKINFSSIPIYSKYNVYIIKEAEKLNGSSANAMLKFVEEPNDRILGFFITNNKDVMIDTIKSRCQSYVMNYDTDSIIKQLNLDDSEFEIYAAKAKEYIELIKRKGIINHKKVLLETFPERENITKLFQIILEVYHQNFLKIIGDTYDSRIIDIYELNLDMQEISKEMKIISKILQEMSYNVNIELILDKFVIEMRGNNG